MTVRKGRRMDVNGPRWQEVLWSEKISPLLEGKLASDELGALACRSARTHRELIQQQSRNHTTKSHAKYEPDGRVGLEG